MKDSNLIPLSQKIAFGIGQFANQMFPATLGIFMVVLVQDLGFDPIYWGIIFFVPRLFDAITDPVMGFISDNTRSKWGKRRQYILLGALIMGVSFSFMWQLYEANGLTYNFWYFLGLSLVFYLGLTIFSIPYVAMGYEMSFDFHERTRLMAIAQFCGQWAWVIAPWFWVIIYDPSLFESAESATRELSIYVAIVCTVIAIIPALLVKTESTENEKNLVPINSENIGNAAKSIYVSSLAALRNKPFRKLCIATFLIFNTFQTIAAFSFFIIVWYLFNGDAGAAGIWPTLHGSVGALVTTFVVIPIVTRMSEIYGKKNAFLISQSISIIGYVLFWFLFVPGKPYLFLYALPFFSFGIGSLFTVMMSMTADVCDYEEYQNGLPRKEGIFGAFYWWMVKFGTAIAGLFTGLIMSYVGFNPDAGVQTDEAINGLRLAYTLIPITGTLLAIYVMRDYEIDEEEANRIRELLKAQQS
jgi:GPH family glycoside/pentoside/hexuronide:cation symporter